MMIMMMMMIIIIIIITMIIIKFIISSPEYFHLTLLYTQHKNSITTQNWEVWELYHLTTQSITLSHLDNQLYHSSWILELSVCNLKVEQCNLRTWSINYLLFVCTVKLFKMFQDNVWSEKSRCQENSCKATVRTACSLLIFTSLVSYTSKVNIADRHAEYVSVRYDEYCFLIYVCKSMILFTLNIRQCIL